MSIQLLKKWYILALVARKTHVTIPCVYRQTLMSGNQKIQRYTGKPYTHNDGKCVGNSF